MIKPILAVLFVFAVLLAAGTYIQNHKIDVAPTLIPVSPTSFDGATTGAIGSGAAALLPEVKEITLSISFPLSGATVTTSVVEAKGKTLPGAEVFANEAEGFADAAGNFSLNVGLDDGENSIIITAVDLNGNVSEKEILVTFAAGE